MCGNSPVTVEFRILDFCYPWSLFRLRAEFERSQWWSDQELVQFQEERLRRVVAHAYEHVPYYRALFQQHGLKPVAIQTLADLPRIPILSRTRFGEFLAYGQPAAAAANCERAVRTGRRYACSWINRRTCSNSSITGDSLAGLATGWATASPSDQPLLPEERRSRGPAHPPPEIDRRLLLNSLGLGARMFACSPQSGNIGPSFSKASPRRSIISHSSCETCG